MLQYYSILGLQPNCTQDDIKKAFHRLAHIHHPDKGGSEENFKKIGKKSGKLMLDCDKNLIISL